VYHPSTSNGTPVFPCLASFRYQSMSPLFRHRSSFKRNPLPIFRKLATNGASIPSLSSDAVQHLNRCTSVTLGGVVGSMRRMSFPTVGVQSAATLQRSPDNQVAGGFDLIIHWSVIYEGQLVYVDAEYLTRRDSGQQAVEKVTGNSSLSG